MTTPATKLLIVGNSGSGKSTFARAQAERLGIPRLELDMIVWEPKVAVARPIADVNADLDAFLVANPSWVIEGCDGHFVERALRHCSLLLFLNPGREVCVENNVRRPYEPHKFDSPEAQAKMLEFLIPWLGEYYTRDGGASYGFHRHIFDEFAGRKLEVVTLAELGQVEV